MTHNLCQGGSAVDGNSWQRLLSAVDADIICAQETRHPRNYLAETYESLAGGVHEMAPHGKWGLAILSRRHTLTALPIVDEFKGWVVGARVHDVETGEGRQDLDVSSVHIPSPGPYERRVRQLIEVMSRDPSERPRIVAGDFNVTVAVRQGPRHCETRRARAELSIACTRKSVS